MDVRDLNGFNKMIDLDRPHGFDIVPDSAFGLEVLYEDLIPIYDLAMQNYEEHVHPQWSLYNPGATLECGKAMYIVDRQTDTVAFVDCQFNLRGVKSAWPRYTLMLEPGLGVAVKNGTLHGGAKHRGKAVHSILIYMTEQGALL